jgi:glycosyltransferase involved in cell wall biosynthesis
MGERLCAENTYDHILALWALPSGHFAQHLSNKFRIPYSVWCLGSDIYTWSTRPVIRSRIAGILADASRVFADGEDLCGRIHAWLGIDATFLPSFRPLDGLDGCEPPPPTDSPRFLYLGRLHRDKGIFELLMAFAHVRMALPHATLRYVGDGPEKRKLETLAAEMHLLRPDDLEASSVLVRGAVSHEGVVRALHECDWVVIPTRSDSIPLVFTEAVQAMRPVIGTDAGDLGSLIRRFRLGHVSPSAESRDLASTMIRAVHDPVFDLRGRAELLQLFDPRRAAEIFCDRAFPSADRHVPSRPANSLAELSRV